MGSDSSKMASSSSSLQPDQSVQTVINFASQIASQAGSLFTATEHLLLAMLKTTESTPLKTLFPSKEDRNNLERDAITFIKNSSPSSSAPKSRFSPSMLRSIMIAKHVAKLTSQNSKSLFSTTDILFGILCVSVAEGNMTAASKILAGRLAAGKDDDATTTALQGLLANLILKFYTSNSSSDLKSKVITAADQTLNTEELKKLMPQHLIEQEFGFKEIVQIDVTSINSSSNNRNSNFESAKQATDQCLRESTFPPTPNGCSHWVYPGKICCGQSPGLRSPQTLIELLDAGVNTFVSLQDSYEEYGVDDYRKTLKKANFGGVKSVNGFLQKSDDKQQENAAEKRLVEFIHAPMQDFGTVDNTTMISRMEELRNLVAKNDDRVFYFHCYSGHGRTGTVLVNLISTLEGISHQAAMKKLHALHRARKDCASRGFSCALGRGHLEDPSQKQQTEEIKPVMKRGHMKNS